MKSIAIDFKNNTLCIMMEGQQGIQSLEKDWLLEMEELNLQDDIKKEFPSFAKLFGFE